MFKFILNPQNQLHSLILTWYEANSRDLPWRQTKNPYHVWLSEIILQQTRVAQGLPYYEAFINNFPTIRNLAEAPETAVLKLWQGLGYYSRARNMHKTAKIVHFERNGVFPTTAKQLSKLPGIGPYTSAAIASFCFKEPIAVLDGNVFRVLSRLKNVSTPINSSEGITEFNILANDFLNQTKPDIHNQAMMEIGATICLPKTPNCIECPLITNCEAFSLGNAASLPVKIKSKHKRSRYFNYFIFQKEDGKTYMRQRKAKDIWQNLYEFPLYETENSEDKFEQLFENAATYLNLDVVITAPPKSPKLYKHILSHQLIYARFWKVHISNADIGENCDIFEVDLEYIKRKLAIPKLIDNYLSDLKPDFDVD